MLNREQRNAVESILDGWNGPNGEFVLPIVEGPPGTGKTEVGVTASAHLLEESRRSRIAYLCYTHYAADRALEALVGLHLTPDDVLRVVDPGKAQTYQNSPLSNYFVSFDRAGNLPRNQRSRLGRIPILISTLHSARRVFDLQRSPLIIMDEFSQVPPTLFFSTLSIVGGSDRNPFGYALLGDPNQLPVITSQPFLRPNIGNFVMSRRGDYEPHRLTLQYRMHEAICGAVNALRDALGTYSLTTHESARERTLTSTSLGYNWNVDACPQELREILDPSKPYVIINTDNLSDDEQPSLGGSKYFLSEAKLAARIAEAMHDSYYRGSDPLLPTVLSPYTAQVGLIKNLLLSAQLRDRCTTIFQAQGREYPCVIVSFARKNPWQIIGFLGEEFGEQGMRAQTYVACSRAMAKLILLFSFSTFRGHRDFNFLLERSKDAYLVEAEQSWVSSYD